MLTRSCQWFITTLDRYMSIAEFADCLTATTNFRGEMQVCFLGSLLPHLFRYELVVNVIYGLV